MATSAVAQEVVFALRHKIATIEGRLPGFSSGQSPAPTDAEEIVLRRGGTASQPGLLATGISRFDAALGGGLPKAALTEIHGSVMHGAGAAAGFALALAKLVLKTREAEEGRRPPILWIGVSEAFAEAGFPYAPGLAALFGLSPDELLVSRTPKPADALWIAEEAARLTELSAVLLETHGNPGLLDLTATRRLHRRAREAGRPVFLLRQSAQAWPTAAPVRLVVSAAPAAPRAILTGPLDDSIGNPAFAVTIGKSRIALPGQFILEWNPHERAFEERRPENSRSVVPAFPVRPDLPAAPGAVLAFEPADGKPAAAHHQPAGGERPAHRRPRRAG